METSYKSPFVVGLTGGIGAGKSTIVNTIEDMGIPVFDCDAFVHQLYHKEENIDELTRRYGDMQGRPRQIMAAKAWADPEIRKDLEAFFIPQVQVGILAFVDSHLSPTRKLVVIDAPTLFEHGLAGSVDWIVTVDAPLEDRWFRVQSREGMTHEKFNAVVDAQISDHARRRRSDSLIFNDSTIEDAIEQTRNLFDKLRKVTTVA